MSLSKWIILPTFKAAETTELAKLPKIWALIWPLLGGKYGFLKEPIGVKVDDDLQRNMEQAEQESKKVWEFRLEKRKKKLNRMKRRKRKKVQSKDVS